MDGSYLYKGQPLQAAMAKSLVLEVLREASGSLQRVDISDEIQRRHLERGGVPARQATADVIKRALWYLEEEGLVVRAGANGRWRMADEQAGCGRDDRVDAAGDDETRDAPEDYTSPSRVQQWYEMRQRQLEALKAEPPMASTAE
jgi:hypothetical protein